jgi:glucose/arabinose dehydrogenase
MSRRLSRAARGFVCSLCVASTAALFAQQNQPQIGIAPVAVTAGPYIFDTADQHRLRVVVMARGLSHPFSLAFLPNGDALITERGKGLRIVHNAAGTQVEHGPMLDPEPVAGVPQTPAFRGGGLHEVVLHPKFSTNGFVYLTYNKAGEIGANPQQRKGAVALARGRFDGKALTNVQEIFVGEWRDGTSGSRLAFGVDGLLYMTTGAPFGDQAQKVESVYGKVLRMRDDGSVPSDNPFVGRTGARPEILSMGHRDQLGLTVHQATGAVLAAEHGPNGGDEINVILTGRNY